MSYFYVYVLKSEKDGNNYVGFTGNLRKRLNEHEKGLVKSTANRQPLKLIYFEACLNQQDATKKEKSMYIYKENILEEIPRESFDLEHIEKYILDFYERLKKATNR